RRRLPVHRARNLRDLPARIGGIRQAGGARADASPGGMTETIRMATTNPEPGAAPETMSGDFSPEQKRYLEGFTAGLQIARSARAASGAPAAAVPTGPDAPHLLAQDRVTKGGGKLSDQEKFKREEHPFDAYGRLKEQAANN